MQFDANHIDISLLFDHHPTKNINCSNKNKIKNCKYIKTRRRAYILNPFVFSICATLLVHKGSKISCSFCAARPIFQTFMEDWIAWMISAIGVITCRWFICFTTSAIFTCCSNIDFSIKIYSFSENEIHFINYRNSNLCVVDWVN